MSVFEMFKAKHRDERLTIEANKVYAVGFFMMCSGLLIHFLYGVAKGMSVVSLHEDMQVQAFEYVDPFLLCLLLITSLTCVIISAKRGLTATSRFANTESFPWKYYLVWTGLWTIAAALTFFVLLTLTDYQVLGFDKIFWRANALIGLSSVAFFFPATLLLCYLNFKVAKRQERKQLAKASVEELSGLSE